jgi:hypothetical protein
LFFHSLICVTGQPTGSHEEGRDSNPQTQTQEQLNTQRTETIKTFHFWPEQFWSEQQFFRRENVVEKSAAAAASTAATTTTAVGSVHNRFVFIDQIAVLPFWGILRSFLS